MLGFFAFQGYAQHIDASGHLTAIHPTNGSPWTAGVNNTAGNVKLLGDLMFTGNNPWILHTPNDQTYLYLAPNSNWNNATVFQANGDVAFSRRVFTGDVTSPGALGTNTLTLAVGGKLGTRSIFVVNPTTPWPDSVFEPAYRLPPLREVEQFIQAHGHLPDVPSAATVRVEGIDVGATQAILLKKIEELTLYVLAMQKANDGLQKRVDALEMTPARP